MDSYCFHTVASLILLASTASSLSFPNPSLLGVHPLDVKYYSSEFIKCKDGSKSFSRDRLNDNFCDCPDGTDEPGTSACSAGRFYCRNLGSKPQFIVSSHVNDRFCDCCDGSDEYDGTVRCPNTCVMGGNTENTYGNYNSKVIKCRAAVAWEAGKPLVIEEVEVAPPQAGEVRLKILYTSLCHTDVYFWEAKGQTPLFPRIFGHEAGGIVESVGEGVTHLKPGDQALPVFTGECGDCPHCNSEESNLCDLLRINTDRGVMINDNKSRFSIKGQPINHFLGTSTFSEYTVVHAGCVAKINPDAPLDKVCILSCGVCTGFGATVNVAKPKPGSVVAIFGLGAVGLAAAEGARVSGASRIIGVDLVSSRFELAKKFGVTDFINPKDQDKPVQEVIAEMTNGGVDRAVECTGSVQAMISAFECVHDGWGVAVLVGVPNKDDAFKTHPLNFLTERTLKGTFYGNYKPRTDLPNVVEKYMKGELELEKFITHTIPFSEINKAFDYMLKGESIRCIIKMEE